MVELPEGFDDRSDRAIALHLARIRWGDALPCPCGGRLWQLGCRPRVFACTRCPRRRSVTAGTLLHRARIPLWAVMVLAHNLTRPVQPSARRLAQALGMRKDTVWRWCQRLRAALAQIPVVVGRMVSHHTFRLPLQPPPKNAIPGPVPEGPHRVALARRRRAVDVHLVTGLDGQGVHAVVGRTPHEAIRACHGLDIEPFLVRGLNGDHGRGVRRELLHQVHVVARGVGGRWIERYAAFASRRFLFPEADSLLGMALSTPMVPFARLAPGLARLDEACLPWVGAVEMSRRGSWGGLDTEPCIPAVRGPRPAVR